MTICFVFKSGYELKMKCEEFSTTKNGFGEFVGYEAKKITENKPLHTDLSEVVCIYRVMTDEVEE